jgi:L-xylulose reductase
LSKPIRAQSKILLLVAEVHEVVDAVVYLLSDRSSMINGVTLPIDGGFLAT